MTGVRQHASREKIFGAFEIVASTSLLIHEISLYAFAT